MMRKRQNLYELLRYRPYDYIEYHTYYGVLTDEPDDINWGEFDCSNIHIRECDEDTIILNGRMDKLYLSAVFDRFAEKFEIRDGKRIGIAVVWDEQTEVPDIIFNEIDIDE